MREKLGEDEPTGDDRDQAAEDRDRSAGARDRKSEQRDRSAGDRDTRAEDLERSTDRPDAAAASARAAGLRDRQGAGGDRKDAGDDRGAARADRAASASDRAAATIDELTGAHRRDAGMVEIRREVARAMRMKRPLVLAYIDVDGLKATNDSLGHVAGDDLLRLVAETMRNHLRPYDLMVRFGGDEFLYALTDMSLEGAAGRFSRVNAALASRNASITVGFAELEDSDSVDALIARADQALNKERQKQRSAR